MVLCVKGRTTGRIVYPKPVLECELDIYECRRKGELLSKAVNVKKNNKDRANLYRYISIGKEERHRTLFPDYRNCVKGDIT